MQFSEVPLTMPLVSIIMPAFNNEKFVKDAVDSVFAQTFTDWELLIVDDCSTDGTWQQLQEFAERDKRLRLQRTPKNSGSGIARNIAIEAATGRYIAFIDSDDWWYPDKLQTMLDFLKEQHCEFACSWYEYADVNLVPYYVYKPRDKQNLRYMKSGNDVGTPGVVYDTARIGKVLMPDFRRGQDWALWLRLLQKTDKMRVCPKALFKYRLNKESVTRNKRRMVEAVLNVYQNELGYSSVRAWLVFLTRFMPRNILKKIKQKIS